MAAVSSPLLETSINGATGVLISVTGAMDMGLDDVETAANIVMEAANPEANIIFGASFLDEFEDEMRVTVIATGFDGKNAGEAPAQAEEAKPVPAHSPAWAKRPRAVSPSPRRMSTISTRSLRSSTATDRAG